MAGLKIEGDLSNVSEAQLAYIRDVLEQRGFKDNEVLIEPVGKAGDNYTADVKRVVVLDKTGETFKMVAKVAPKGEMGRLISGIEYFFKNEHIMYTKVLPKFDELQKAAGIPEEQRLRYAACYGSYNEAPNEIILLEDLKETKFEMMDRFAPLPNECVKSVLKNFATLHSLSFALKRKEPELFDEYKNSLFDLWSALSGEEHAIRYFSQLETSAILIMESEIHKKVLKGIVRESINKFAELASIDRDSNNAIIQQGDLWTNNIMFKFDEGSLSESIMIDYQLSKVASPVADLLFMIFNCTDYKSRKENFQGWVDIYYTELDKNLSKFGIATSNVYPRDQLDIDLKRYGKISLWLSLVLASIVILKPEDARKKKEAIDAANVEEMHKNNDITRLGADSVALFKSRVEGIIDSLIELDLIKVEQ